MVGEENVGPVIINGFQTSALIDSGSQISTVTAELLHQLHPEPFIGSMDNFGLDIKGAGGHSLEYFGYTWVDVTVPFIKDKIVKTICLVAPQTEFNKKVPVIVGTNTMCHLVTEVSAENEVPKSWNMAFKSLSCKNAGIVKATGKIVLQPLEVKTVTGLVRKVGDIESVVRETSEHGCTSKLQVCLRVVTLNKPGTTVHIPVKLFNISAKAITIEHKSSLCELQDVKVIRSADISKKSEMAKVVNVHQQNVAKSETENSVNIDLTDSCLTEEQKGEANSVLSDWKHVFSQGATDLGCTRLVQHEINLEDDKPFKEPYRHISPALM